MREWGERDPRWSGIRSESWRVDTTDVHLLRADGPTGADAGSDVPRLLVHGLGGASLNWLEVMGGIARTGSVAAPDLPGFGATEPPNVHAARIIPQVTFIRRLLDALGWDRVELHGNSMGGMISTLFAARYPDRVARLVLVNPALPFAPSGGGASMTAFTRFAPFVSRHLGRAAIKARWRGATSADVYDETLSIIVGEAGEIRPPMREVAIENTEVGMNSAWRQASLATAAANLVYTSVQRPLRAAVEEVAAPTLLLWGDQDRLVSRATIDRAARRRPDWTRIDLPDVGHAPMLEVPDTYLEVVDGWRSSLEPA